MFNPLVIEFAGTPRSGKDTIIRRLETFYRDVLGYSVYVADEPFALSQSKGIDQDDKFLFCVNYVKTILLDVPQMRVNLVFLNRGLFDLLGWYIYLKQREVNKQHVDRRYQRYPDFITYPNFGRRIHKSFLLQVTPQVALARDLALGTEHDRLLARSGNMLGTVIQPRKVMDPGSLKRLNENFLEAISLNRSLSEAQRIKDVEVIENNGNDVVEICGRLISKIDELRGLPLPQALPRRNPLAVFAPLVDDGGELQADQLSLFGATMDNVASEIDSYDKNTPNPD